MTRSASAIEMLSSADGGWHLPIPAGDYHSGGGRERYCNIVGQALNIVQAERIAREGRKRAGGAMKLMPNSCQRHAPLTQSHGRETVQRGVPVESFRQTSGRRFKTHYLN